MFNTTTLDSALLEIQQILAETRGTGLVNIYKMCTGKTCAVESALGLATSAVVNLVAENSELRAKLAFPSTPSEESCYMDEYDGPGR